MTKNKDLNIDSHTASSKYMNYKASDIKALDYNSV